MPVIEVLTTAVGSSIAKWIIGEWIGDGIGKELSSGLIDAISPKVPDFFQRRRIERQMQLVAESSAEKLAQLIAMEFRGLDESEQIAAAHAAGEVLLQGLGEMNLVALDYDPVRLKKELLTSGAQRVYTYGLSEDAVHLYNLLLSESSSYIIEVVTTLPSFTTSSSVEILRRETALIDMIREIYAKLPDPGAGAKRTAAEIAEFETSYRRFVARRLDRLELFGLSASEFSSRYALSVAYITLGVKAESREFRLITEGKVLANQPKGEKIGDSVNLRIDDAIGSSTRIFVRGAAGSGKTTLMQWIAVRSARGEFDGPMEGWNRTIPFFLQLRRFSKGALPTPDEFLSFAGNGILERAPTGWVIEQLLEGRAILLIDGVDEVAESERSRVRRWLADLIAAYPDCRYVVTSRPSAVAEDWLQSELFTAVDLQPMTMTDIKEFVSHWHQAAARNATSDEHLAQLARYQVTLTDTIAASRQIRSLATTPLLCAMLCALNRDRRTQLPKDRVELYRIALEMLLERRDLEREVDVSRDPQLSLPEKLIILRELAYWLVLNEQSDIEYADVIQRFTHRLKSMPGVQAEPESVLKYLLVRSGLLREPVQGRIDFIHRTFQEYLAAVEVSELGHIPMLVTRAAEDNWREVVILAAGTCHSRQKAELLQGLLRRGHSDTENQHTLYLLAVACLETAREVPPELVGDISDCLNELLPPKNVTEAKELASAGELALARLSQYNDSRAAQAAACVRAACLIGGESSISVLKAFSTDHRKTVQRELLRCWSLHDMPAEYGEQVLGEAPLLAGDAHISDSTLLPYLPMLKNLKRLNVTLRGISANLDSLRNQPQLALFDARGSANIDDLSFLSDAEDLVHLDLEGCENIEDLGPISNCSSLMLLDVSGSSVTDLSPLAELYDLSWLSLRGCHNISEWSHLSELVRIEYLDVSNCSGLNDVGFLTGWDRLERLYMSGTNASSLDSLGALPRLRSLTAMFSDNLRDISGLSGNMSLHEADFTDCDGIYDAASLVSIPALERLDFDGCENLRTLPAAAAVPNLRFLGLFGCRNIRDISALEGYSELATLNLSGTSVGDLSPLSRLRNLTHLFMGNCTNVGNLSPLAELPHLKVLSLSEIDGLDLRELWGRSSSDLTVHLRREQVVHGVDSFKATGGRVRYLGSYYDRSAN
ncbi:NACHT domain-containing protein [Micromonospora sp. PLK6-60]|uniref:NACHT N-terminal Helical domain 1-containing protein n=1 Tax=Micromonospora sp. PLK6-60 TaxID=2873383 RepID=UPI001CA71D11|nr:NACHT domain-containing protein [Micromonospora sp. PLK6-60]MBY8873204.1 NACHT domain-containing protein [Micromonospora sp. PLK6-60]